MSRRAAPLYAWLAWAGVLPFAACAALSLAGIERVPQVASVAGIAASYGLLIAAFMAGTHWGVALRLPGGPPAIVLVASNAVALAAWFAFLLAPLRAGLLVLAFAFVVLYLVDRNLAGRDGVGAAYLALRRNVTAVVVAALLLTAYGLGTA